MLFDPTSPATKFGYFTAGEHFKSYSQFETQEYAAKTGNKVEWNFNDEFFSTIDWTAEPTESLKELYAERVRQLRNKYDYIVLYFSGGSDSHNILSAFYDNNIYLDEILTYHTYEGEKDKLTKNANMVEITLAAVPEANRYIEKFPTTVHRIVDISTLIQDYWKDNINDLKFNFIYYSNFYVTPHHTVASELPTILPEYQRLIDSGKRVCFIHGNDKPNIRYENKKWFYVFRSNGIDSSYTIRRQIEKAPFDDVLFYWDPDAWKIIVKQAHTVRNYLYKNHHIVKQAFRGEFQNTPMEDISGLNFNNNLIPMDVIKNAVYPYWRNDIIDIGKTPVSLYGIKNQWWTKSNLPGAKEHIAGIKHIAQHIGADITNPQQITYLSKQHYF